MTEAGAAHACRTGKTRGGVSARPASRGEQRDMHVPTPLTWVLHRRFLHVTPSYFTFRGMAQPGSAAPAAAAAPTPGSAASAASAAVGPTRKTLFRKSGGGARSPCAIFCLLTLDSPCVALHTAGRRVSPNARVARRGGEGEPDGQRCRVPPLVTLRPMRLAHPTLVLVCVHRLAALVEEMLNALREEVKEMDRTNWLYETQDPQVGARVKI